MAAAQNGMIDRPTGKRGTYRARWRDENGDQRAKSGFAFKTKPQREKANAGGLSAREFLDAKVAEIAAVRNGTTIATTERHATVDDLLDDFLERHGKTIDPATKRKLTTQLKHARATFGDRHPDTIRRLELEDWQNGLPAGSRHDCFRALRQALTWGVGRGLLNQDATEGIKNPKRARAERKDVHPSRRGPKSTRSPRNSTSGTRPSRSCSSALAYAPKNCSASTAPTSTGTRRYCTSGGGSRAGWSSRREDAGLGAGRAVAPARPGRPRRDAAEDRHADSLPCSAGRIHRH
jgi:hypothetical protein